MNVHQSQYYTFHVGIELCDAVNEIFTKVPLDNLHKLGRNLGLDDDEVQQVLGSTQYHWLEEKYQYFVELWFRRDDERTWEKLRRALPPHDYRRPSTSLHRMDSLASVNSVSGIAPSTGKKP